MNVSVFLFKNGLKILGNFCGYHKFKYIIKKMRAKSASLKYRERRTAIGQCSVFFTVLGINEKDIG